MEVEMALLAAEKEEVTTQVVTFINLELKIFKYEL